MGIAFRDAGLPSPQPVMICESLLALPDMVAHSRLFTTLPVALYERAPASLGLRIVPLIDPIPTLQIAILRMKSVPLTPAAQELLRWIRLAANA